MTKTAAARAGVAESAFYEVFRSAEECFSAAFEEGLARLCEVLDEATGREERWLDSARAGLVALLGFLDDEPSWGRLLFLGAPVDGAAAFRSEQRVRGALTVLLGDGGPQATASGMPESHLTAELVIGGVFSLIRAQISEGGSEALVELAPSLMSFIVLPYLGQAAAAAEFVGRSASVERACSRAAELPIGSAAPPPVHVSHRTTLVLGAIAAAPRSSNREIAEAAGLSDEGQTSHLLRRLTQRGLIEKVTPRSGSRRENAWLLTPCGRRVVELLGVGVDTARAPVRTSTRVGKAA